MQKKRKTERKASKKHGGATGAADAGCNPELRPRSSLARTGLRTRALCSISIWAFRVMRACAVIPKSSLTKSPSDTSSAFCFPREMFAADATCPTPISHPSTCPSEGGPILPRNAGLGSVAELASARQSLPSKLLCRLVVLEGPARRRGRPCRRATGFGL